MKCRFSLVFVLLATLAYAQPSRDTTTTSANGQPQKWQLAFYDEFSGAAIDRAKWDVVEGLARDAYQENSEQWCDPANVEVSNGTMKMHVKRIPRQEKKFSIWITDGMKELSATCEFSSGEISTKKGYGFGMYEARCRIPKGKGIWPAFWMYGAPKGPNNEIDVFEFWNQKGLIKKVSKRKFARVQNMTAHYNGGMSGVKKEIGPDFSEGFHTFSVIWDAAKIEWYTDGKLQRRLMRYEGMKPTETVDAFLARKKNPKENVFPRDEDMKIIFDVAVQNRDARPLATDVFPINMEVDYVRYYVPVMAK